MKDDAVAPVIAAMLLLAVGVTFFAAWNAYFVPSMKAQSEISHIKNVEDGFLRFSSDIGTVVSLKKTLTFSEPIPLGGGDFMFDPVKSGGELKIWNPSPTGYLKMNWTGKTGIASPDYSFGLAKFSYKPVNNFWQDQGYGWSNGNVYVINPERNLSTPLKFTSGDAVTYGLAGTLIELEPAPAFASPGNCSSLTLRVVNISADSQHFRISGNGNGMLGIDSVVRSERIQNATGMTLAITGPSSGRFQAALWESVNASVEDSLTRCGNVRRVLPPDPARQEIRLGFGTDPSSGLTLIRETTEITISAY